MNNPEKIMSNKEINFSTLQKFYKGDEVSNNVNLKDLSLKESVKQRTIIQKFQSFYRDSYQEAQQFINILMNDKIAVHLMDEKDIKNYMERVYNAFQSNFDLSQIKQEEKKYYLLFLEANYDQFSSIYHSQFYELVNYMINHLTSYYKQIKTITVNRKEKEKQIEDGELNINRKKMSIQEEDENNVGDMIDGSLSSFDSGNQNEKINRIVSHNHSKKIQKTSQIVEQN